MNKILMLLVGFFIIKEIIAVILLIIGDVEFNRPWAYIIVSIFTIPIIIVSYIAHFIKESYIFYVIESIDGKKKYKISKTQYHRYKKNLIKKIEKETKRQVYGVSIANEVYNLSNEKDIERIKKGKEFYNVVDMEIVFKDEVEDCD